MKKIVTGTIIILAAALLFARQVHLHREENIQAGIAEKIIRFHVIANSDAEADQQLKLQVKEQVVTMLEPLLSEAASKEEARQILTDNLEEIEDTATQTLQRAGCDDTVKAGITTCYFPVKTYGEFTFPDGEYEALRVVIGDGEGKNWWCVMYPRLCFVDSLYSVVPESSKKELQDQLTDEEYEAILNGTTQVKIKSKLLEILGF